MSEPLDLNWEHLWKGVESPGPTGWVDAPKLVEETLATMPVPLVAGQPIQDTGKGKVVLLHQALATVRGSYPVLTQAIGDCVSFGYAKSVMVLIAVQILLQKAQERWVADVATEPIYGGSRVEVGGGGMWGDGSTGAWAAKFVSTYGVLLRQKYEGLDDFSTYSGSKARQYGRQGLSSGLETIAREHPVKTASLVTTYEQARDVIANGGPIPVCSNRGFASRRDEKGFARPQGRWPHCMAFVAVDDADPRPGLLCDNSWGPSWISGPKRHDQPEGSFWVDAEVADAMLRNQDSFGLSAFVGWPTSPVPLDNLDWSQLWTPTKRS